MHLHVTGAAAESRSGLGPARATVPCRRRRGALVNAASTEDGGGSPSRGAIPGMLATLDEATGTWRLTGEKTWTTWLPALRYALVSARVDGAGGPAGGRQLPRRSRVARRRATDRLRGHGDARFGVRAPSPDRRRRPRRRAVAPAWRSSEPDPRGPVPGAWFAICIASVYLGVGEGARESVARWALDRRPGDGSTAVADLPTIQLRLGRADAALRSARIVVEDVARRWDAATATWPPDGRSSLT